MKIFKSFYFAFNGIRTAFLSERNLKIHLGGATFIILVAFIFKISLIEWALIDSFRCLPVRRFPFMIHFEIEEPTRTVTIFAVVNTYLNPEKNWLSDSEK